VLPENYFDNAATTPLLPAALEAMLPWLTTQHGNPHSLHSWGTRAQHAIEQARTEITELLNLEDPSQIIFTSGATESCNTFFNLSDYLQISPFEHSALRVPAKLKHIPIIPNQLYSINPDPSKTLILTACSNETGALYSTTQPWYCDATQIIGKLPFDLSQTEAAAFSAHKFGGPMGVGVLYLQDPNSLNECNAHQVGGGQEHSRRSGTLNVHGIIGLATALRIALQNQDQTTTHVRSLRQVLQSELEFPFNDAPNQSPYIASITIPGIVAQNLVLELDRRGYAISSGAACSSASTEPSPVLIALGLSTTEVQSTIRISFSAQNTPESTKGLAIELKKAVQSLRTT
jgi:cysteine desulfurase